MTSTSETSQDLLSDLHNRYLLLSGRFKSAWTFHQFLKGVNKVFGDQSLDLGTVSFQSLYSELKVASKNLNVASASVANNHLDRAERELETRLNSLLAVDESVTPTLLRRFFKRVRNYDARILGQLLKFYLFTRHKSWGADRQDKADFLLTRLGELLLELNLEPVERQPHALRDSLRGIWQVVGRDQPDDQEVDRAVRELVRLRAAMDDIESLEDFHQLGVLQSYRDFKRGLDAVFFHPAVALQIVEINLFLAKRVENLYQLEERRVATEYNKVFELERDVTQLEDSLDVELRDFRTQVEDLERSVQGQNVKIDQLVSVKENARGLIPRLEHLGRRAIDRGEDPVPLLFATPLTHAAEVENRWAAHSEQTDDPPGPSGTSDAAGDAPAEAPSTSDDGTEVRLPTLAEVIPPPPTSESPAAASHWRQGLSGERPVETLRIRTGYAEQLGEVLRQVLHVLENSDWQMAPQLVTQVPEARALRLEGREVLAYRRLFFPDRFDRTIEQFLVEAAALRVLLSHQAEELVDLFDDSENARQGALHEHARSATMLASEFERRFQHFIMAAVLERNVSDALDLQLIWMRLLREYSGLWLLLNR